MNLTEKLTTCRTSEDTNCLRHNRRKSDTNHEIRCAPCYCFGNYKTPLCLTVSNRPGLANLAQSPLSIPNTHLPPSWPTCLR